MTTRTCCIDPETGFDEAEAVGEFAEDELSEDEIAPEPEGEIDESGDGIAPEDDQ